VRTLAEPIACGNETVAILEAEIAFEGVRRTLSPIVAHFVFDDAGKVQSLRSFFDY